MVALPAMAQFVWKKIRTVQGTIAAALFSTLIIGLFLGSPVGKVVCGLGLISLAAYIIIVAKREGVRIGTHAPQRGKRQSGESQAHSQHEQDDMKTLLFDDFQPPSPDGYVVKEISVEETIVPSTKKAQRVALIREEKVKEFEIGDFFDVESDVFRTEVEPQSEFHFVVNKVLAAIKEVLFAHSVAFFWVNRQKQQMVLEARATESLNFMLTKRYPIGDDVASQVARTGKPQVLGRVSQQAEAELVRHYVATEGIRSLVVVPVFYVTGSPHTMQLPEGVIIADSKAEDAFGTETLSMLGQFTKVISALIKSYTNKYDLLLDSELLASLRRLQDRVKAQRTERAVLDALADEAMKLVHWDVLTVTMYSDEQHSWAIQKILNRTNVAYQPLRSVVDYTESAVGKAIRTNALVHIGNLEEEPVVRFVRNEAMPLRGSFLCIPLSSFNRCYGVVALESAGKYHFSAAETDTLQRLVERAGELLEVLYLNDLVKEHIAVDQPTGSLNDQHFRKKLEEEVLRANDLGAELALVQFAMDDVHDHLTHLGSEGVENVVHQVAGVIRSSLRPYDVIGRTENTTLSILLISTTSNNAYLWAEKIRKQIASTIFSINGESCAVTFSGGVCGLNDGMSSDELLSATSQVLRKAIESGGNLIRVF